MSVKRRNLGVTLPKGLVAEIDKIRKPTSGYPELEKRDRSTAIEILIKKGLEVQRDGKS